MILKLANEKKKAPWNNYLEDVKVDETE